MPAAAPEEQVEVRSVSGEEFAKLDFDAVTLVDLRDENLRIAQGELPGSFNVPLSQIGTGLSDLPQDKPVYVFCNTGDFSEEVVEILTERGYDAFNVEGGFKAYRIATGDLPQPSVNNGGAVSSASPESTQPHVSADALEREPAAGEQGAEPVHVDAKGLKCPGPIVAVADAMKDAPTGQRFFVEATEDAFASDIAVWCSRTGNPLENLEVKPDVIEATIVKGAAVQQQTQQTAEQAHGKTFVVFSGDLDKTIAAFIMANGGAAMGREVTMFFTFWGLNILRKPQKVSVAKSLVEKAFGFMMPRGTRKLGLSRMNMLGAGPKMIRSIMKSKGVSSLEELIDQARDHGVRLVACQMSMEIMGIHQEELIDGVELGGVATFLGSGEQSDISLFI